MTVYFLGILFMYIFEYETSMTNANIKQLFLIWKSCLGAKAAILYTSANQSRRTRGNYIARISLEYAWWTQLCSFSAEVKMPSGNVDKPVIEDNHDGTVSIKYEPREEGLHEIYVKFNGEHVQGKLIHSSRKLNSDYAIVKCDRSYGDSQSIQE